MKTIVGLFDSFDDARGVMDELGSAGFDRSTIRLENEAKGEHAFLMGEHASGGTSELLTNGLMERGVPKKDAILFCEGVRRGGTLIILSANDKDAIRAYDLLAQHGSVNIDERMQMWQKSGWSGFGDTRETAGMTNKAVLPVVEEELRVGKREIETGGVRAEMHVVEKPVEEKISLHEEHVSVERHKVDRPLSATDKDAFRNATIEVHERAEEAVVSKRARVIEEVVIAKEAGNRTETIRDTVRKTEVNVEQLGKLETRKGMLGFEDFDTDFRTHYKSNFASKGGSYDDYLPVYRYGYRLATDERYRDRDWSLLESDARTHWEERNPGTWEQFKDSVRHAWERVRSRR